VQPDKIIDDWQPPRIRITIAQKCTRNADNALGKLELIPLTKRNKSY